VTEALRPLVGYRKMIVAIAGLVACTVGVYLDAPGGFYAGAAGCVTAFCGADLLAGRRAKA